MKETKWDLDSQESGKYTIIAIKVKEKNCALCFSFLELRSSYLSLAGLDFLGATILSPQLPR